MKTVGDKCSEQPARYLSILNGVWYRVDASMVSSGRVFRLAPQDIQSAAAMGRLVPDTTIHPFAAHREAIPTVVAPPIAADSERSARAEPNVEEVHTEIQEKAAKLFTRESGEPLCAGHPDLWNLLVAGTCLEGSTFSSG